MFEEIVKDGVATLVRAMATDAWPMARDGVVRLFRRKGRSEQEAMAKRLDKDEARVSGSGMEDPDKVRVELAPQWRVRIQDLIDLYPAGAEELRELEREIRELLPKERQGWTQYNVARDGGQVFAAQGGDVKVNQLPPTPEKGVHG